MYPELEEVKRLAKSGEYKRIPVCRELYADRFTPVEVMRTLRAAGIAFCSRARRTTSAGGAIRSSATSRSSS